MRRSFLAGITSGIGVGVGYFFMSSKLYTIDVCTHDTHYIHVCVCVRERERERVCVTVCVCVYS